jgi:hypothetical protein
MSPNEAKTRKVQIDAALAKAALSGITNNELMERTQA